MHRNIISATTVFFLLVFVSCRKESQKTANICTPDATISRTLSDKKAKVEESDGTYFLVEENTIDTKLRACNLPDEFKIEMLTVTFSGITRLTYENSFCCIEDLEITKIAK